MFREENMLNIVSMGLKVHIKFRPIFIPESPPCHFLGCEKGRGGPRQTMTKCDKGGGQKSLVGWWHNFRMAPIPLLSSYVEVNRNKKVIP